MKISELFEDSPGKKGLMSGNEAFARGIFESGVKFAANYPGTPMSEVGDYLNYLSGTNEDFTFDYSLNEKVALESCIGASWAGVRTIVMFKHLGLNVAADPLHTFPYSGVVGGMVILCGGDPGILSSTNSQDNRLYSLHTKIPIIEPSSVQECSAFIKEGFKLSELYDIPVYIHVTNRLCHSHGIVTYGEIEKPKEKGHFDKNPKRYINTLWKALDNQKKYFKKVAQIARNKKLYYLFNQVKKIQIKESSKSLNNKQIGILTSGVCYSYVIQACHKLHINPPILKLGLIFPINREEICHFANEYNLNKLLVVEELEAFIETLTKRVFCNFCDAQRDLEIHGKDFLPNIGELNTDMIINFFSKHFKIQNEDLLENIRQKEEFLAGILPKLPIREPTFCPGCQYRPVFYALKKIENELKKEELELIYGGDISCATLSEAFPFETIDWVVCMAAGVGIADGMVQVLNPKKQKIVAFMGDSTFFHSGIQPILNAIKNNIDITILILYNYWTAMTGHQPHMGTPQGIIRKSSQKAENRLDLIKILKSFNIQNLTITSSFNIEKLERIFSTEIKKSGVKVIIIEEECTIEKKRRISPREGYEVYYSITDSCVKCNECIEILGCTAIDPIIFQDDIKYKINETRCIPYICPGVCKQTCKNNAIKKTEIFRELNILE